jgi:hypothetical protein
VKTAVLQTMVFDESMIVPLYEAKVPVTLFLERSKQIDAPLIERYDDRNLNLVY